MEFTGTNTEALAKMAGMHRTHLCRVLSGSRRCSLGSAIRLAEITGVPVQNVCEWPVRSLDARRRKVA